MCCSHGGQHSAVDDHRLRAGRPAGAPPQFCRLLLVLQGPQGCGRRGQGADQEVRRQRSGRGVGQQQPDVQADSRRSLVHRLRHLPQPTGLAVPHAGAQDHQVGLSCPHAHHLTVSSLQNSKIGL